MDDLIVTGDSLSDILAVKSFLHDKFTIKDLGNLKYILGIEIARSDTGLHLCQRKYTLDLLDSSGYLGCKPCSTPMDSKTDFSCTNTSDSVDAASYRRIVGKLLYLTITRLDISYVVHTLSQYMSNPNTSHLQAVHRLLRYLKTTPGQGVFYSNLNDFKLHVFTDSD